MQRHDIDVFSLVAGLFFVGIALIWGFAGHTASLGGSWELPALLIGVGAVGLVSALPRMTGRRRGERR